MILQINWNELHLTIDEFGKTIYSFPVHIRVLLAVIVIFFLIILTLLFIILASRIYKTNRARKRKELQKKYQPVFRNLLFQDNEAVDDRLLALFDKRDMRNKFRKEVIGDEIIHLHENFKGEIAERLEVIFRKLNYDSLALNKLKNRKWYVIAKGIREMAHMNLTEHAEKLHPFLNHKNQVLRMEARIALMRLRQDNVLAFLTDEQTIITDWDTANIHSMLIKISEDKRPDFRKWLGSAGSDVNLFSIRMIGAFKQHNATGIMMQMISNRSLNEKEKKGILKAFYDMNAFEAEETLLQIYEEESGDIKLEILKTLEKIGTEKSASLLKSILLKEDGDITHAIHATRALMKCSPNAVQYLHRLGNEDNPALNIILNHAKESRL